MKSTDFLQSAIDVQAERGKQYDSPEGERSMGRTMAAFNAITGRDLAEAEGWLLLQILKDVRQWQNPEQYHHDSALDGVAYASLKAEALHAGSEKVPSEKTARALRQAAEIRAAFDNEWLPNNRGRRPNLPAGTEVTVQLNDGSYAVGAFDGFDWSRDTGTPPRSRDPMRPARIEVVKYSVIK